MPQKFYPTDSAMTKQEVIDMINERLLSNVPEYKKLGSPNILKLSDPEMQTFTDQWYNTFINVSTKIGPDVACDEQEKLLVALAKKIQRVV